VDESRVEKDAKVKFKTVTKMTILYFTIPHSKSVWQSKENTILWFTHSHRQNIQASVSFQSGWWFIQSS